MFSNNNVWEGTARTVKLENMKVWTVRLKRTVSPNEGLIEGLTLSVTTQQNNHDYAELQKAVKANTNWRSTGGIWSDSWWDWS